jgi:hypothetical protein
VIPPAFVGVDGFWRKPGFKVFAVVVAVALAGMLVVLVYQLKVTFM